MALTRDRCQIRDLLTPSGRNKKRCWGYLLLLSFLFCRSLWLPAILVSFSSFFFRPPFISMERAAIVFAHQSMAETASTFTTSSCISIISLFSLYSIIVLAIFLSFLLALSFSFSFNSSTFVVFLSRSWTGSVIRNSRSEYCYSFFFFYFFFSISFCKLARLFKKVTGAAAPIARTHVL